MVNDGLSLSDEYFAGLEEKLTSRRPTQAKAFNEWFHGLPWPQASGPTAYEIFKAGWRTRDVVAIAEAARATHERDEARADGVRVRVVLQQARDALVAMQNRVPLKDSGQHDCGSCGMCFEIAETAIEAAEAFLK